MKKFLLFAAACVALVACNNNEPKAPVPGKQITLTANVDFSQGSKSPIRTMAPNTPIPTTADQTVNFHWEKGDKVMITDGDTKYSLFTIDDNSIQGTTANFTGTALDDMSAYFVIYAGKDISAELAEQILSCTYELNNAANNYNIVAFSMNGNESGFTLNGFATTLRLQLTGDGITLGSLKYYTGYGAGKELKTTINFGTDGLALSSTTQEVWVPASSVESNMTIGFYDTDGKLIMEKRAGLASVLSGDNDLVLCPALEVVGSSIPKYICFESLSGNSTVEFRRTEHNLEWSTDGTNWSDDANMGQQTLSGSQKLYIRATSAGNLSVSYTSGSLASLFKTKGSLKVGGNVMYLLNGTSPSTTMTSDNKKCFKALFHGQTAIHDFSDLTLPATTLADNCYEKMFYNCSTAVNFPSSLPAMQMKPACYQQMFAYCSTLVNAPALPATTLASYCYAGMFEECTSLQTAPSLPAESLATNCYANMFSSCTKLASVTMLATNGVDNSNLEDWLGFHAGESASGTPTVTVASGMKTTVEGTLDTNVWKVVEQK